MDKIWVRKMKILIFGVKDDPPSVMNKKVIIIASGNW